MLNVIIETENNKSKVKIKGNAMRIEILATIKAISDVQKSLEERIGEFLDDTIDNH